MKKTYIIGTSPNTNRLLVLTGDPTKSTYTYEQRSIDLRNEKKFLSENIEYSDGINEIKWVKISRENLFKIADGENLEFLKPNE